MKTIKQINTATFRVALTCLLLAVPTLSHAAVATFDDLNYWGSGSSRSALVIDWNDGKTNETLAWGFNWTGTLSVTDMLVAIANTDSRFFARIDSQTPFGLGTFGFGYDTENNGLFSVTGAQNTLGTPITPVFTNGIFDSNTGPTTTEAPLSSLAAAPGEIADHYVEGWFDNGFWEFFTGDGLNYPSLWTSNFDGASGTTLQNNGWYAFSITSSSYDSNLPGAAVAAVPEPSAVILLLISGFGISLLRSRNRHA